MPPTYLGKRRAELQNDVVKMCKRVCEHLGLATRMEKQQVHNHQVARKEYDTNLAAAQARIKDLEAQLAADAAAELAKVKAENEELKHAIAGLEQDMNDNRPEELLKQVQKFMIEEINKTHAWQLQVERLQGELQEAHDKIKELESRLGNL